MKILSIIIPLYNVENYISKCLYSCIHQDLKESDYEIIIINDGSTDNSVHIANKIAQDHSNIKIILQNNKGASAARNTGLKYATGKYIWFVDSDDYISKNILAKITDILLHSNLEIIWLMWQRVNEKREILKREKKIIKNKEEEIVSGEYFLNNIIGQCFYAWAFIFKRAFLIENSFKFRENIIFEDIESFPFLIHKANRIQYSPIIAYNYLQRKESTLNRTNLKIIDDLLFIIDKYQDWINKYNKFCNTECFEDIKLFCIRLCISYLSNHSYSTKRNQTIIYLKNNGYNRIYKNSNFLYKALNLIWNYTPRLTIYLFKVHTITNRLKNLLINHSSCLNE